MITLLVKPCFRLYNVITLLVCGDIIGLLHLQLVKITTLLAVMSTVSKGAS